MLPDTHDFDEQSDPARLGRAASSGAAPAAVLVVAQLEPLLGMEQAALHLVGMLRKSRRVKIIVLSGARPDGPEWRDADIEIMGIRRRPYRLAVAGLRLRRRLRALPGDATVIAVGIWAAIPTLLAVKNRRVIVWEHSLSSWRLRHDRRLRLLLGLARAYYRRAYAIVTVSDVVQDFVSGLLPDQRVLCISNAVPQATGVRARSQGVRAARRLVCIGSLNEVKNVELAVRALALLPADIELFVAGAGPQRKRLEHEARSLGLETRAHFLGHVTDVDALLETATVVVHPAWVETFGFALIEAAQHNTPVVALDRPNMNRLVPELVPGILVAEPTEADLAAAILVALEMGWPDRVFDEAATARGIRFGSESIERSWNVLLDDVAF